MKIQTILSIVAGGLLAVGCKDSTPQQQSNAAGDGEVRGVAIAKLQEPTPAPITPAPVPNPLAPTDPAPKPVSDTAVEAETDIAEIARQAALETSSTVVLAAAQPTNAETLDETDQATYKTPIEVQLVNDDNPAPVVAEKTDKNPAPQKPAVAKMNGEFLEVGFDQLAGFEYEVPEEEYDPDKKPDPKDQPDQIPTDVKAFNKKRVALKGFMMPLKVEDGLITEMLIMRDQSACCYGTVPKINEWVSVKMTGKGVKPIMDQTITVFGRLKVGEMRENGYLIGIYEMDGEKIIGPLEF
ncbi:MAG: DUF3299 domain-containing protein [Limisphaerales bacterium]